MNSLKKPLIIVSALFLMVHVSLFISSPKNGLSIQSAFAEKEEWYTSSEEFLPLGARMDKDKKASEEEFLKDESFIHDATIEGIKILKEENKVEFTIAMDTSQTTEMKDLKFNIFTLGFPSRVVVDLYGVKSEEKVFRFFKNLEVLGIVLNPFTRAFLSQYVIFFEDWIQTKSAYERESNQLIIEYTFSLPQYENGYGVRIADTKIDPLPHIIEIKHELENYGLESYLLIASDHETVVLESPFYATKEEAIEYIESLEKFGYKGKLALRNYRDFPKPHRFDVVSQLVITEEGDVNLKHIVYTELPPGKIHDLSYSEIFIITKDIFSPKIQENGDLISEYYYNLSEMYRSYDTEDVEIKRKAYTVSSKMLEIIYFEYPHSAKADDALWDIAHIIREYGIEDDLTEEECYRKIIEDYPNSIFVDEAKARVASMLKKGASFFKKERFGCDERTDEQRFIANARSSLGCERNGDLTV